MNTVAPGATKTEANVSLFEGTQTKAYFANMAALDRLGRAEDVADAIAFLASDDGRWVTGHVLDVSGGLHLGPRIGPRT